MIARDGAEGAAQHRFVAKLEESTVLRYALAPLCIAVAVLLHISVIGPFLHPTGLFLAGVVAAAWFGGAGSGLLAALLATLALPQLIEMNYPLVADFFDLPRFLAFGITGVAVGWGTTSRRRAEKALRRSELELRKSRSELEVKVAERTAALRFSEERYARAMDGSGAGHWEWNMENDETFVSARAQEMLGLGAGPLPAKRAEIMPLVSLHPEDRQSMAKTVEANIASGSHERDFRVITASGDVRWLRSRAKVFRGDGGEPARMTGSLADITGRKEAEEKLKRSEAFLAEAQRLSLTGSFGWNVASGELFWSDETYEIVGLDRVTKPTLDEVLRRVHPADLAFVQNTLGHATREGEALDFEYRFLLDDCSVKHVHVRARAITSDSGELEYVGAVTDMTTLKRSQQALRLAVDTIPGLVWSSLPDGNIDFLNQRWREYTGLSLEEAGGWRWQEAIHPDDVAGLVDYWKSVLASGESGEKVARLRRYDGEYRWFLFRAVPLYDESGKLVKWYGTCTDIEDRKRAETFLAGEKRLLEMIARRNPLPAVLDALCRLVEENSGGALCSVLLLDPNLRQLRHGAAPSLPESYTRAIDGGSIGERAGSCGTAAFRRAPVIVEDITTDPLWEDYRSLAAEHGLRACWSVPIMTQQGSVLGTFAVYKREPGNPDAHQLEAIEQVTHIASIAIERTRAEEELLRQRAYLDELFDLAPDAIVLTDAISLTDVSQPRILRINKEFTRVFGYTPEEAVGQRLRNLVVPDDVPHIGLTETPDLLAGKKLEQEVVRRRKDGTRFNALITAQRIRLGETEDAAYYIYRDITERKRAEEELRSRQEMLDLAQKAARAVAFEWRIAPGGEQSRWSPDLEAMYGLAPGACDGTFETWKKLVHREDWPSVNEAIERANESGNIAVEYRVVHPDGAVRWLQAKGRILSDGRGQPERMVGFMLDVTEHRHAEEELRRLEHQLRRAQRLEAMGTLAGGIAHDFNNILGAILGYGEMALRDAPGDSRLRRDLESITAAGERGRALVDRILAFSRSGVGERVAVDVEKVVRESLDLLMANLPAGITVKTELRAGRAAMRGDPTQVHQVVMNLATNGIQAMDSGGILRISLGKVRLDAQHIATTGTVAAGNYILLKVADAGRGIPAGILDRIFDPFFTTKEVGVGTGLGLSLVHGIVTEVGGAIDVETTVGAGTVFIVYLPHAGDVADGSADEQPAMPRGDQQRVLVVDDEEPLVRLATETLEELGYLPIGFTSSADALAAFRANPKRFDAVITDERMPGLSGSALIREMRGIRRSIPILLVSGYVGGMVVGRAYNAGANEVLKKPLSTRELATSLARVLHPQ